MVYSKAMSRQRLSLLIAVLLSISTAAVARPLSRQLRILALGDSITEGAVAMKDGVGLHPYTWTMQQQLEAGLAGTQVYVQNEGVGGAGIYTTGTRIKTTIPPVAKAAIQAASAKGQPFDYVIVMAGINDLVRSGNSAQEVVYGLKQIYDMAVAAGSHVIAIPPFGAPGYVPQQHHKEAQRKQLAQLIKGAAAAENSKHHRPRISVLDLQGGPMDFYSMSTSERNNWLCDGLHLTEAGYDFLGKEIASAILGMSTSQEVSLGHKLR